ncbi:hypothetical protein OGAPHI_002610 [Ogataea philodendri]|uniref:Uncharacterized protein n=1 Tax=Ogataea philodendri TaxID=1378263 RepID=A0A9P8T857_9ASCO|nr:uncharacterized protein OGAPHI_002610 [Ogataea philodendri]KAH3668855.1 hypothetical protein OGAPHI_002610 [Ogataea philodendri]
MIDSMVFNSALSTSLIFNGREASFLSSSGSTLFSKEYSENPDRAWFTTDENLAGCAVDKEIFLDGLHGLFVAHSGRVQNALRKLQSLWSDLEDALGGQVLHVFGQNSTSFQIVVTTVGSLDHVPQESLKVGGNTDVHSWRVGLLNLDLIVFSGVQESVEDVVFVGCNHQLLDRKSHLFSVETSKDVTKVSAWHHKLDLEVGLFSFWDLVQQLEVGVEVVSHLCEDSSPVDRVDCSDVVFLVELGISKHFLHNVLTVVKGTFHRKSVDVIVQNRGHLLFLQRRDSACWVEDEHRNVLFVSEAVNSSGSSVTGSGSNNGDDVSRLTCLLGSIFSGQEELKQITDKLQSNVFESVSWAVEQLQQVQVLLRVDRDQWSDLLSSEGGVGLGDQGLELVIGDLGLLDVESHDVEGQSLK